MVWQKTLKYPVLMIGMIWMGIFVADDGWVKLKTRFYPDRYTCDTLTLRIKKKVSDDWEISCPDSMSILVVINFDKEIKEYEDRLKEKNELANKETAEGVLRNKANMYKVLTNDILKLAKAANKETLENVKNVHIFMVSDKENLGIKVYAKTDGAAMVLLRNTIYESKAIDVVKKAKAIVADQNIKDPVKRSDLEEEVIHALLKRKANSKTSRDNFLKKLKELVKISEEKL